MTASCCICKCRCTEEVTKVTVHTCLMWDKGYTPKPEFEQYYCSDCTDKVLDQLKSIPNMFENCAWKRKCK